MQSQHGTAWGNLSVLAGDWCISTFLLPWAESEHAEHSDPVTANLPCKYQGSAWASRGFQPQIGAPILKSSFRIMLLYCRQDGFLTINSYLFRLCQCHMSLSTIGSKMASYTLLTQKTCQCHIHSMHMFNNGHLIWGSVMSKMLLVIEVAYDSYIRSTRH